MAHRHLDHAIEFTEIVGVGAREEGERQREAGSHAGGALEWAEKALHSRHHSESTAEMAAAGELPLTPHETDTTKPDGRRRGACREPDRAACARRCGADRGRALPAAVVSGKLPRAGR